MRVPFERMVVAAGAADACSQKRLGHRLRYFGLFDFVKFTNGHDVVPDRRVVRGLPLRHQHVASEFVPRAIRHDLLPQPLVELPHTF